MSIPRLYFPCSFRSHPVRFPDALSGVQDGKKQLPNRSRRAIIVLLSGRRGRISSWRGIEVVITGLTRNQFGGNVTWVRIPSSPHTALQCFAAGLFCSHEARKAAGFGVIPKREKSLMIPVRTTEKGEKASYSNKVEYCAIRSGVVQLRWIVVFVFIPGTAKDRTAGEDSV